MTKDMIFNSLMEAVEEILPDIKTDEISSDMSLKDIGANSVDRMDIIIRTMELTKVKVPLVNFGKLKNMQGVVDLIFEVV